MKRITTLLAALLLTAASVPALAQKAPLGEQKMAVANAAAAEVVKERMKAERPGDYKVLQQVKSAEIIVVSGSYDRVEDVLNAVDIQHLLVSAAQLDQIELNAKQLLIVNCGANPSPEAIQKIRRFVKAGGFLYTTDWALTSVVEPAFPGYVRYNQKPTANDVVAVTVRKKDNVFLQHLTLSKEEPKWWLESSSYPIEVLKPKVVEVLIDSREMKKKYGESAIAVTFPYGDGRVLHIASHFYLQQNETRNATEKKSGDTWLTQDSNLPEGVADKVAKSAAAKGASGGDINSAYSAQQMTTNIVVQRKKDQKRIDSLYSSEVKEAQGKKLKKGEKVRIVEKKDGKALVRDMQGDELWVDEAAVE